MSEKPQINHIAKELLAKLIAQENITVVHKNVQTAGFDIKNRVLVLPHYKDITENIYDIFVCHECSHAINTPQKYVDIVASKVKEHPAYPDVINILEDVRVDRIIKKKFPGVVKSYYNGYRELSERDFFGIKNQELSKLHLIDRLNLYYKLGIHGYLKLSFSEEEKPILSSIDKLETFDDVVKLADELISKIKSEKQQESNQQQSDEYDTGDSQSDESKQKSFLEKSADSDSESQQGESDRSEKFLSGLDEQNNQNSDQQPTEQISSGGLDGSLNKHEIGSTYNKARQNLERLFVDNNAFISDNVYIDLPMNLDLSKVIIDYKDLHKRIHDFYSEQTATNDELKFAKTSFENFKLANKPVVCYLAKEFEMKKAADAYYRSFRAKTGLIDTDKIHGYRYNDNIFLKKDIFADEKNHGLVMFIDCSDSMRGCIADTYEQLLNLVLFCKRTNIHFEVYGFSSRYEHRYEDSYTVNRARKDAMIICNFTLKNYFSSRMSAQEFYSACVNIYAIINFYRSASNYRYHATLPNFEVLGTTPLNESIICAEQIINNFRQKYGLQKVNAIFLTDGHSNPVEYWDSHSSHSVRSVQYREKVVLRDISTKKEYSFSSRKRFGDISCLYRYLKDKTNVNIIGFYLLEKSRSTKYILSDLSSRENSGDDINEMHKKFGKDGHIAFRKCLGYDELYVLLTNSLEIDDEEFFIEKGQTHKTISKDFSSSLKGKVKNRIILSKFIEQIA